MCINFEIIFIAGVHGVGKGFLCQRLSDLLKLPTYSSSTLIKGIKNSFVDIKKQVIDADKNQELLIKALSALKPNSETIILDGHFSLLGKNNIIDIPIEVFQVMPLKSVVSLHEKSEVIFQRIKNRVGETLSIDDISFLQEREFERSRMITSLINVPFFESTSGESAEIANWLTKYL